MQETVRQLVHMVFGLAIAGMVLVLGPVVSAAILAGGLFIGIVMVDLILRGYRLPLFSRLVKEFDRNDSIPGRGALYFAVSALVCVVLVPVAVSVPALVALAVLDSVTTVAGLRFGRHRIHNGKSWEGTGAGILVTTLVLLPFLTPGGAVSAAVVAGAIELVSPVDDNLVIPVAVAILLLLVPGLVPVAV
jgi:phytol kinase